jgi:hypothetical protein
LQDLLVQVFSNHYLSNKSLATTSTAWKVFAYFIAFAPAVRTLFLIPSTSNTALAFADSAVDTRMRVDPGAFTKCTLSYGLLDVNFTSAITDLAGSKLG